MNALARNKAVWILAGTLVAAVALALIANYNVVDEEISSFQECVAAGNPVMPTYPGQCQSSDGRVFLDENALVTPVPEEEVFCTQDARECPDGSFVGRVGPTCEFAPCPGT